MKRTISTFVFCTVFFVFFLSVAKSQNYPQWVTDQLELRDLIEQSIGETQKWQHEEGYIFQWLNTYKWDDEVEIFFYWLTFYYLTGDESVYESVKNAALTYIRRAESENRFEHGYYKDAFYDTEHTLEGMILLANLAWAKPQDSEVVDALEHVIEHVGNWVEGYEPWYNPATNHLRSIRPGTKQIDTNNKYAIDWAFNLQFVKMALALYYATGNERYLNWSKSYLDGWTKTMEKNEQENGFYVLPSSVDPYTGEIGPYSGVWYESAVGPGWSWVEKGNNANRDMRGAFLDYYRLTGEHAYLETQKKHIQTLFDNGTQYQPAHYYDGEKWIVDDDKVTVYASVQVSLLDDKIDQKFDNFINSWYNYLRYPFSEMHFWAYHKIGGGLDKINEINGYAIHNATNRLRELQALTELPGEPDDFPKIGGTWGISLVPFGGIAGSRGEMPWVEVLYYKDDLSVGLENGMTALFEKRTGLSYLLSLCNTNLQDKTVYVQAGFQPKIIKKYFVNDQEYFDITNRKAQVVVPAGEIVQVRLETVLPDTLPPLPPQNLQVFIQIDE